MTGTIRRVAACALTALVATAAVHGQGGVLNVSIEGAVPGGASVPVMLLRESFEALLKKNGLSLADWHNACAKESPQCQQAILQLAQSGAVVGVQTLDLNGRTAFAGVPPGRYFVFVMRVAASGNALDVWDVAADVQKAPVSVQLTARNLVLQNGARTTVAAAASAPPAAPIVAAAPRGDPAVARARAAKVDTHVFGIPLGEPLRIRECESLPDFALGPAAAPPSTCLNTLTPALLDFGAAILPFNAARQPQANAPMILLGKDNCPIWMATCQVTATIVEGVLVGVTLVTKGPSMDALIAKELRSKYGAPTFTRVGTVTPDSGKEFTTNNLEWVLPGLHVEYEVVRSVEVESTRVRTNEGQVRIETETAYLQRQQELKELTKPKL